MPRSKKGVKRPLVEKISIEMAVEDILKKKISFREAAKVHNVSRHTLMRHVKKHRESGKENFEYIMHYDVNRVFSCHEEAELVSYLKHAARLHYGLTLREVRSPAFQFAKVNNKKYPEKWNLENMAGKSWLRGFRKKFKNDLSLRKPEATSLGRSTGFNKASVLKFFDNYKTILERRSFAPERIWNCDETGISTVHVPPKVLAPKGVKQIGSMTSGERGNNVTMISAINAIGNNVPPMLIFPRVNFKDYMMKGAPPGAIGAANLSGWSNEQLFLTFLNHFIKHTKPSPDDPVLLLMDNHESHVSLPAIIKCKEAGIILLTFHPHISHKMQPLDLGVFGPFKTHYNTSVNDWMISPQSCGKPLSIYEIAEMVGKAYPLSFTPKNIISGFRVTGIVPFNRDIFGDEEFLPSSITDRPMPDDQNKNQTLDGNTVAEAGPSNRRNSAELENLPPSNSSFVTPEVVKPFPKAGPRKLSNRGRPKGKSRILTDTPEKEELEKIQLAKDLKKNKKVLTVKRDVFKKDPPPAPETDLSSSSSDELDRMEISSNSDDDISLTDEVDAKQLEEQLENETINVGDFLLIKLSGKKSTQYYAAKVVKKEIELNVIYLKKAFGTDKFLFDSDNIYIVEEGDVILKLPPPMNTGGSARQQSYFKFSVDLSSYNMN